MRFVVGFDPALLALLMNLDLETEIPPAMYLAVAEVLAFGAEKHQSDFGWQKAGHAESHNAAALLRHFIANQRGEKFDSESGLLHAARALFILWFEIQKEKNSGE